MSRIYRIVPKFCRLKIFAENHFAETIFTLKPELWEENFSCFIFLVGSQTSKTAKSTLQEILALYGMRLVFRTYFHVTWKSSTALAH